MEANGIGGFFTRYNALKQQHDTTDQLIQDILVYCANTEKTLRGNNLRLSNELHNAQLDIEDSKSRRRDLQEKVNSATQQINMIMSEYESMRNRNPYVIVLIDGDGMIFKEAFIRQGIDGGKQAAVALRSAVLDYYSELPDDVEIIAKVCANISGLAKAMRRDGSLENLDDFKEFTLGFTQGKASFDFVDVGHGKERADSKIKECLRFHLRNHNCQQILLGISHDAGYAPFIDDIVKAEDKDRITIIQGPPTVRELVATGLDITEFEGIFRSEKLVDKVSNSTTITTNPNGPSTWASVSAIPLPSTSPNFLKSTTIPLTNGRPPSTPPKPTWNPGPRGLDPAVTVSAAALEKVKRRAPNNKLCNNHYLRGPCVKDECTFEHDYKASDEEIKAIAHLTRQNVCTMQQECEVQGCIYGHHCPSVSKVGGQWICNGLGCRFPEDLHPPGTVIKNPRKERMWDGY